MNVYRGNAIPVAKLPIIALAFLPLALAVLVIGVFFLLVYCLAVLVVAVASPLVASGIIKGEVAEYFRWSGRILAKAAEVIRNIWVAWKNAVQIGKGANG
jgi:hypothetical protein